MPMTNAPIWMLVTACYLVQKSYDLAIQLLTFQLNDSLERDIVFYIIYPFICLYVHLYAHVMHSWHSCVHQRISFINWNRFGAHKPTWFLAPFVMHIFCQSQSYSFVTNQPSVSDWVVQVPLWPSGLGVGLWNRRPGIDTRTVRYTLLPDYKYAFLLPRWPFVCCCISAIWVPVWVRSLRSTWESNTRRFHLGC